MFHELNCLCFTNWFLCVSFIDIFVFYKLIFLSFINWYFLFHKWIFFGFYKLLCTALSFCVFHHVNIWRRWPSQKRFLPMTSFCIAVLVQIFCLCYIFGYIPWQFLKAIANIWVCLYLTSDHMYSFQADEPFSNSKN